MIGAFVPVLPTTPFVILAAACFGKGSPALRRWLLETKTFGPIIRDWEARGAIATRYKVLSIGMMAAVLVASIVLGASGLVLAIQSVAMLAGAAFILTRPGD